MTEFKVYGPMAIPFSQKNKNKKITPEDKKKFLADLVEEGISKKQGCYIFCLRAGPGFRPWYVGKATKGIHQECMHDGKINRYNQVLFERKTGTPVMFFVLPPGERKNKAPEKTITEMEKTLIKAGYEKNKDIKNTHHAKDDSWTIKGVYGKFGGGKPTKEESSFRKMLNL